MSVNVFTKEVNPHLANQLRRCAPNRFKFIIANKRVHSNELSALRADLILDS